MDLIKIGDPFKKTSTESYVTGSDQGGLDNKKGQDPVDPKPATDTGQEIVTKIKPAPGSQELKAQGKRGGSKGGTEGLNDPVNCIQCV